MNIDINNLLINHMNQQELIKILQDEIAALQKEKQALWRENEVLRHKIADLKCEEIVSHKQKQGQMVINIGM